MTDSPRTRAITALARPDAASIVDTVIAALAGADVVALAPSTRWVRINWGGALGNLELVSGPLYAQVGHAREGFGWAIDVRVDALCRLDRCLRNLLTEDGKAISGRGCATEAAAQIAAESALRTIAREIDAAIAAAPVVPAGIADDGIVAVAREVERLDDGNVRQSPTPWRIDDDKLNARDTPVVDARGGEIGDFCDIPEAEVAILCRTAAPALARYVLAHTALLAGPLGEWREATRAYHKASRRRFDADLTRDDRAALEVTVGEAGQRAGRADAALLAALDGLATAVPR